MHDLSSWTDSVALVTGASAGIGASIVRKLHAAGLRVAFCARRVDRIEALEAELGERAWAIPCDLRDEASIDSMFDAIRARWGGVTVLVNNAGLGHDAPLRTGTTELWREMLEVNVLALCICTREALKDMGDRGHVIHISSMAGHRVPGGSGVYSATKHAVKALTEGLRLELREAGSNVRVSAISPGYVETEFAAHYNKSEEQAAQTYARFPCLQPDDVAEGLLYLLAQPAHVQVHDLLMRPTRQPT